MDMLKERLMGIYRDYVKYMLLVAPDFPGEIERFAPHSEKVVRNEDIDKLFGEAERYVNNIVELVKRKLRESFEELTTRTADACFIKMEDILLQSLINEILKNLQPDLVKMDRKYYRGYHNSPEA